MRRRRQAPPEVRPQSAERLAEMAQEKMRHSVNQNINNIATVTCPLMSGAIDKAVNPDLGDRNIELSTVMSSFSDLY